MKTEYNSDFFSNGKSGFENALLLTPPRFSEHYFKSPSTEGFSQNFQPYRSPDKLPHISPMTRKILFGNSIEKKEI